MSSSASQCVPVRGLWGFKRTGTEGTETNHQQLKYKFSNFFFASVFPVPLCARHQLSPRPERDERDDSILGFRPSASFYLARTHPTRVRFLQIPPTRSSPPCVRLSILGSISTLSPPDCHSWSSLAFNRTNDRRGRVATRLTSSRSPSRARKMAVSWAMSERDLPPPEDFDGKSLLPRVSTAALTPRVLGLVSRRHASVG